MERCEALRNLGLTRGGKFMCRLPEALISGDALPQVPLRSTWGYSWCQLSELAFQPVLCRALGTVVNARPLTKKCDSPLGDIGRSRGTPETDGINTLHIRAIDVRVGKAR